MAARGVPLARDPLHGSSTQPQRALSGAFARRECRSRGVTRRPEDAARVPRARTPPWTRWERPRRSPCRRARRQSEGRRRRRRQPIRFVRLMVDDVAAAATAGFPARSSCAGGEHGQILRSASLDGALVAVAVSDRSEPSVNAYGIPLGTLSVHLMWPPRRGSGRAGGSSARELRHGSDDLDHEPSGRCPEVDVVPEGDERHPQRFQFAQRVDQVPSDRAKRSSFQTTSASNRRCSRRPRNGQSRARWRRDGQACAQPGGAIRGAGRVGGITPIGSGSTAGDCVPERS